MSFLNRLAGRVQSSLPPLMPKGLRAAPALPLRRQEEEEEETLATVRARRSDRLRRQPENGDTESEETVAAERDPSTVADEPAETDETAAPLRRQAADGREPDEEVAQTLRRESAEEEEGLQTIRRQEEVPLEEQPDAAPPPGQAELEPGAEPLTEEYANEEAPATMQALRRAVSEPVSQGRPPVPEPPRAISNADSVSAGLPDFAVGQGPTQLSVTEPRQNDAGTPVVIEQVDVVIHEPAAPAQRTATAKSRDRAIRARYLRRL